MLSYLEWLDLCTIVQKSTRLSLKRLVFDELKFLQSVVNSSGLGKATCLDVSNFNPFSGEKVAVVARLLGSNGSISHAVGMAHPLTIKQASTGNYTLTFIRLSCVQRACENLW